jgi:hypothetical protein
MSVLQCQINISEIDGLKSQQLTVGRKFNLKCSGELPADFNISKAQFKLIDAQTNTIKIFKIESKEMNVLDIHLTLYAAKTFKINDLILTDGTTEVNLSGSDMNVETVIEQPKDGKPTEAFGSIFPIGIATPAYYYLVLVLIILSIIAASVYRIKRFSYYKKLKDGLKAHQSPIDPDTQFYKSIRQAEKLNYPIEHLEKSFKLYNLRAYSLPLFELNHIKVLKYFKRNYPQCKNTRLALDKILGEFVNLKTNEKSLSISDKREFVKKLHRYIEVHKGLNHE